jgi:hypothetical protein
VEIFKKFSRKCGVFLSSGDFPSLMDVMVGERSTAMEGEGGGKVGIPAKK